MMPLESTHTVTMLDKWMPFHLMTAGFRRSLIAMEWEGGSSLPKVVTNFIDSHSDPIVRGGAKRPV